VLNPSGPVVLRPAGLPARSLAAVAAHLGTEVRGGGTRDLAEPVVTGVALDSRAVQPGDLYAAPAGARAHGADFAKTAADSGAVACLTDEAGAERALAAGLPTYVVPSPRAVLGLLAAWVYGEPARDLTLIGVTGTNGKTTTAYLLEAGLRGAGLATGLVGTIETRVGDEVVPSRRTTPEAPEVQALLAVMRERGVQAVAMEVSSHALAMGRVDGTTYDVAVFTNLSEDHLDFHADLDDYFAVKASLFTPARSRLGVVNVDDEHGRQLVTRATVPLVTVSPSGAPADWRVEDARLGPRGSSFSLVGPDGRRVAASTTLAGDFNLANAAFAVVALVQAGIDPDRAAAGVATCAGVPGRMERVEAGETGPLALVDFAHTPDALQQLLAAARGLVSDGGRVLLVVGAGGDRDPHKRPAMGASAVRGADVVVLTSDNPRSEDPLQILAALRGGAEEALGAGAAGELVVEPDRRAAVRLAASMAGAGDVLVVAGKGHETGQEVDGVVTPFDDRLVLAEALRAAAR
jgi:UDP-N-acetylmuramoyl-L-alanyl-D-glutamate--2,6-diaminopimelate ligase